MKHKSETFEKFKEFQSEVENHRNNHLNNKINFLRSDRGGEYLSYEFYMHLNTCGIVPQLTPPETPQRNGVSERRNRTLFSGGAMPWLSSQLTTQHFDKIFIFRLKSIRKYTNFIQIYVFDITTFVLWLRH